MGLEVKRDLLESYLRFNPVLAIVIASIILTIIILLNRKRRCDTKITINEWIRGIGISLYIAFLFSIMLLNREYNPEIQKSLSLFESYRQSFQENGEILRFQIACNIMIFIPWTLVFSNTFPNMNKMWSIGSALAFSVIIETTQLIFKLGVFEFDDMFNNTLGALIGYAILRLFTWLKKKGEKK